MESTWDPPVTWSESSEQAASVDYQFRDNTFQEYDDESSDDSIIVTVSNYSNNQMSSNLSGDLSAQTPLLTIREGQSHGGMSNCSSVEHSEEQKNQLVSSSKKNNFTVSEEVEETLVSTVRISEQKKKSKDVKLLLPVEESERKLSKDSVVAEQQIAAEAATPCAEENDIEIAEVESKAIGGARPKVRQEPSKKKGKHSKKSSKNVTPQIIPQRAKKQIPIRTHKQERVVLSGQENSRQNQFALSISSLEKLDDIIKSIANLKSDITSAEQAMPLICAIVDKISAFKQEISTPSHPKIDDLVTEIETILMENQERCLVENKAFYWYKLGQIYHMSSKKTLAIEPLTKAVKLEPTLVEAWNELGECYCHIQDVELSRKCFENAISHERNKNSLRNLSVVMRKLANNRQLSMLTQSKYVQNGILYAKEAVSYDVLDGMSWGILGNAYLSAYFLHQPDSQYARLAYSAYRQAEHLNYSGTFSELFYNKAFASKYAELFEETLLSLDKAIEVDPVWDTPLQLKTDLIKYLDCIQFNFNTKGKLKQKRIMTLRRELEELKRDPVILRIKKDTINISEMVEGVNKNVILLAKIIWNVRHEPAYPFTCGIIDAEGATLVLTVYNVTPGKGFIIGDSVVVFDPRMLSINFKYAEKEYSFATSRIDNPTRLIVNKRPVPLAYYTPFTLITAEKGEEEGFT